MKVGVGTKKSLGIEEPIVGNIDEHRFVRKKV